MSRHSNRLDLFLGRVLGDSHSAEDVRQDTWCSVWSQRDSLDVRDPWPYIRAVGLRKAIDRMRREKKAPRTGDAYFEPSSSSQPASHLAETLAALAREERAVLVLFFWEGLSVKEIADLLESPEGTVKTWMFRARRKVKTRLEAEGGRS